MGSNLSSMTAFARRDVTTEWGDLTWEVRSVNHRYLDITTRLPELFRALEPRIRDAVAAKLNRGRVDCTLSFRANEASGDQLDLDEELLHRLVELARRVEVVAHNVTGLRTVDLLRWPGVIRTGEMDTERLHAAALEALEAALAELVETRRREGERLAKLITERLESVQEQVEQVRRVLPEIVEGYRERLRERLSEVREELDPARVEQEVVLFAQKTDVAEELDRLAAHVDEVRGALKRNQPVGRRLDFLMQELNREANTLGSKSGDLRVTNASVELKVLIEQMREQVQNIE